MAAAENDESLQAASAAHLAVLRRDLDRRSARFAAREALYESELAELEALVVDYRHGRFEQAPEYHGLQRDVLENLQTYEQRSASIVREREGDLNRACRARLKESAEELRDLHERKEAGIQDWKKRVDLLTKEKDWARNLCDRLEDDNRELTDENARLVASFKSGERERRELISKLAQVRRETCRCEQVVARLEEIERRDGALQSAESNDGSTAIVRGKLRSRTKSVEELKHVERLLDHQQKQLADMRAACANDAEQSVALQRLLRHRILDISEALRTNATESKEQLSWQNRVLTILYENAFPARQARSKSKNDCGRTRSVRHLCTSSGLS